MSGIVHWLEQHMLSCPSRSLMGLECPGCGMQRSFIALLKGDLVESLALYPALIPVIITFTLLILHLVFRFRNGAKWIKLSYVSSAAVIMVSYIIRQVILFT